MADIFISYAREDAPKAEALAAAFAAEGWTPWFDKNLVAGRDYPPDIQREIDQARCVVVLWSMVSVTKQWVWAEANRAEERGILVPALLDGATIPLPFNGKSTVMMASWNGRRDHPAFLSLLRAVLPFVVSTVRNQPTAPKPDEHQGASDFDPPGGFAPAPATGADSIVRLRAGAARLSALASNGGPSDDALVILDTLATELRRAAADFPDKNAELRVVATAWQHAAERLRTASTSPTIQFLLAHAEKAVLPVIGEPLSGSASPETEWAKVVGDLVAGDALESNDALERLFRMGAARIEKCLLLASESNLRPALMERLWRAWPRIRLHHKDLVRPLARALARLDTAFWEGRFALSDALSHPSIEVATVLDALRSARGEDQAVIAEILLSHANARCRQVALDLLSPERWWDTALYADIPLTVIAQIVERACEERDATFIKALFLLTRERIRNAADSELPDAYRILTTYYHVDLFLEEAFFAALTDLRRSLSRRSLTNPLVAELERSSMESFKSFCGRERMKDADIERMSHVPLPIQRQLANAGYFPGYFICNVRDVIALETVPHVVKRPDVVTFLRMPKINAQALEQLAKDRLVMQEQPNRVAFCHNPKAKKPQLMNHMTALGKIEWQALAIDKGANQFAREHARRLLVHRGAPSGPPPS